MSRTKETRKTEQRSREVPSVARRIDNIALGLFMVGFAICIAFSGTAQAWTYESAPLDNETLNIGFNPTLNESTANNPYPFGLYNEIMEDPLLMSSYLSNDPVTVCTSYIVYKQVWDGSSYQQITNCNITIDTCVDLVYNPISEAYELPDDWSQVVSNGFLVKKYFQDLINSDSEYCSQWNSSDDTPFPDVMYTYIDVDVDDGEEHTAYMYTSLDDGDIESLSDDDIDYGFALDGRGSDGGSGSIYEGIDLYGSGAGDESGMGAGFGWIFYGLIPIIFLFAVFKMCQRVLWGGE